MNGLSNDVKAIIHRYIYDVNFVDVKVELLYVTRYVTSTLDSSLGLQQYYDNDDWKNQNNCHEAVWYHNCTRKIGWSFIHYEGRWWNDAFDGNRYYCKFCKKEYCNGTTRVHPDALNMGMLLKYYTDIIFAYVTFFTKFILKALW